MRIKIVTDSTSDLPRAIAEQHDIEVVPLKVMFGNETYRDGVDMDIETFYDKLTNSGIFPTTSQPSPAEFEEVYRNILAEDDEVHIISLHVSANLSGTFQAAQIAKSMLSEEEASRITIVDSKYVCYGLAVFAVEMAKLASTGGSVEQCLQLFEQLRASIRLYFVVDTLEFLQRGGRIGKASAFIGSLLNIKPILSIDSEGLVSPVERVRGLKNALKRIRELLIADFASNAVQVTVMHSKCPENAQQLAATIQAECNAKHVDYASIGPVIGTHVGPGSLAVVMYPTSALQL
jgi:DegV family protein with EDD domain